MQRPIKPFFFYFSNFSFLKLPVLIYNHLEQKNVKKFNVHFCNANLLYCFERHLEFARDIGLKKSSIEQFELY